MAELSPKSPDAISGVALSGRGLRPMAWAGGVSVLAGAIVMAGWFTHADLLIRLGRNLPPMRFNTALAFVLLGMAFLMSARRWTAPRQVVGVLLLVLAAITLVQFLSGANFGIDQLFVHDYLPPEQGKFPGRMSPATAVGFLLTTAALLLGDSRRNRIGALLAPLLALLSTAQAFAVLLNFSLGLGVLFTSQVYAGMALHTAVLLFLLAGALLYRLWHNQSIGLPPWLPLAAGIATLIAVMVVWQALKAQDKAGVQRLLDNQSNAVEADIQRIIDQDAKAFRRMARRWETRGGTPRGEWQIDADEYVADIAGLTRIDWIDASGRLRWAAPADGSGDREGADLAGEDWFRQALQPARKVGDDVSMSASQRLDRSRSEFFLTARLVEPDRDDGMLRGVFDARELLATLLQDRFDGEVALEVGDAAGILFSNVGPRVDRNGLLSVRSLVLYGRQWELRMFAGPELIKRAHSLLPEAVLLGGLVMALLLMLAMHASITAVNQRTLVLSREATLRESEAKYRQLLESMLDGLFVAQDERFVFVNPALASMLGYRPDEIIGLGFDRVVAPSHLPLWLERYRLRMASGPEPEQDYEVPFLHRYADRTVWVELHVRRTRFNGQRAVQGTVRDISEKREAAAALAASEARFRSAMENAAIGMALISPEGRWLKVNRALCAIVGYTEQELTQRRFHEITHPDDLEADLDQVKAMLSGEIETYQMEKRYIRKDGREIWVRLAVSLSRDSRGAPEYFISQIEDIDARKRTQDELRRVSQRLMLAMSTGQVGIWEWDVVTNELVFDRIMLEIYGWEAGAGPIEFAHWVSALHPDDRARVMQEVTEALDGRKRYDTTYRIVTRSGEIRHIRVRGDVFRDGTGRPSRMVGTNWDVSDSVRATEARAMLATVYDQSPDAILVVNHDGRIVNANTQAGALFRRTAEDLVGSPLDSLLPARFRGQHADHLLRYFAAPQRRSMVPGLELFALRADGSEFPVDVMLSPMQTAEGVFAIAIVRDVSERKAQEAALRESELRFRTLVEGVRDYAIYMLDPNGRVATWNVGAQRIKGYETEEIVGKPYSVFFTRDDVSAGKPHQFIELARRDGSYEGEGWRCRKDGSRFWASFLLTAARDADGKLVGFAKITRDITERKHQQDLLTRMAELSPSAVTMVDAGGRIQMTNAAMEHIFGYTRAELIGLSIDELLPARFKSGHPAYRADFLAHPNNRMMGVGRDLYARRKDGSEFPVEVGLSTIETPTGRAVLAGVVDISERKNAERRLQGALAMRTAIFNSANVSIIATDGDGLITAFNRAAERMLGYSAEEMIDRQTPAAFHDPEEVRERSESLSAELDRVIEPGFEVFVAKARLGVHEEREWTYVRKDGSRVPVLLSVTPIVDPQGGITGFLGIASDITERQAQAQRDRAALKEKEMLLKEIYHRVKNNLQVIQSLLNLQSRTLPDAAARDAMKETANRIHAMALVHEKLYRSGDLSAVNLAEYVGDLLNQMGNSTNAESRKIKLYHDVHSADVGIDIAIPFGLLLNEMVSNSLKHAFPDNRGGEVRVTLEVEGGEAVLTVVDNGVGIKSEADLNNSPSMGYKLIRSLTMQLRGKLSFENVPGAKFTIHFREWG